MEINFKDTKLEKIFNCERDICRKFGPECAREIMRRMAVLHAANSLADVTHNPPERRHQLSGNLDNHFTVDAKHPKRLIFIPNHNPLPRRDDGGLDLTRITAITIVEVRDYHGK